MSISHLEALRARGIALWLDDLSRELLDSGALEELIHERAVAGVTTNPSILSQAIASDPTHRSELHRLIGTGLGAEEAVLALAASDVRSACDLFSERFEESRGADGWVSIEVSPLLAHDCRATVAQAKHLVAMVDRPNVMIKIPATEAGLEAIIELTGAGISTNATLVFSITRYRQVANAYLAGLERARTAGADLSRIRSVASVFVSRFDGMIDPMLRALEDPAADALLGRAGVANALLCHRALIEHRDSERFTMLNDAGANEQRLLWASTGTKSDALPPAYYVDSLAIVSTVNTVPPATLDAVRSRPTSEAPEPIDAPDYRAAEQTWNELDALGLAYTEIVSGLEGEGLTRFVAAWTQLCELAAGISVGAGDG